MLLSNMVPSIIIEDDEQEQITSQTKMTCITSEWVIVFGNEYDNDAQGHLSFYCSNPTGYERTRSFDNMQYRAV